MTTATTEAVAIKPTKTSKTAAKPKGAGGRPKGYNPLMPLSTTPTLVKAAGDMATKALDELSKLGEVLGAKSQSVDDLLALLSKSETITQDLFAAASVRWLQRGMLLTEIRESYIQNPTEGNWMEFYLARVQPITKMAERSEQCCRTLWRRWLECQDMEIDATPLLTENLGVNAMNDALNELLQGTDPEDAVATSKKRNSSAGSSIQTIRSKGRSLAKEAAKVNADIQDPHLRALVSKLNEVLAAIDEYTGAWENGTPAVQTTATEVDIDVN